MTAEALCSLLSCSPSTLCDRTAVCAEKLATRDVPCEGQYKDELAFRWNVAYFKWLDTIKAAIGKPVPKWPKPDGWGETPLSKDY